MNLLDRLQALLEVSIARGCNGKLVYFAVAIVEQFRDRERTPTVTETGQRIRSSKTRDRQSETREDKTRMNASIHMILCELSVHKCLHVRACA